MQKEAISEAANRRDYSVVPEIIAFLNDREFIDHAISVLGILRDSRAVAPLISTMRRADLHRNYRHNIALALKQIGHAPTAAPLLALALADRSEDVRLTAAYLLPELGDASCTPALIAAASDPSEKVAAWAVEALAVVGDARAFGILVNATRSGHASEKVLSALLRTGGQAAVPHLVDCLRAQYVVTRRDAATVLRGASWVPPDAATRALYLIALEDWNSLRLLGKAAIAPILDYCLLESTPAQAEPGKNLNACALETLAALNWAPVTGAERATWALAQGDYDGAALEGAEAIPALLQAWDRFSDPNAVRTAIEKVLASHAAILSDSALRTIASARERRSSYQQSRDTEEFASSPETVWYAIDDGSMKEMARAELARRGKA